MGKKNSKIQQETVPPLAQYLAQRAQQVRDSAALELQQQEAPDVPVLPRTSDNTIAYWDAKLGTPDSTLIERYGVEPNPETCIYTVTTKYGDKDATFTGNKTFKDKYNKRGYVKIPNDSSSTGDIVQLNQLFGLPLVGRPYHAIMQTSASEEGTPLYSYSRGDTTPYVVEDGRKIATMQKDRPLKNIKGRADSYTTYRYVGSPSKREEWTNEYNNKYGTQRSNGRLGVTTRWSEGGSLKEKSAWDNLSLAEKAEMIGVAVKNGITTLHEIRAKYNEFAEGGREDVVVEDNTNVPLKQREEVIITPDTQYNQYLNTLPDNQRFTPNDKYDSYLYWKLNGKPNNFKEAYNKGMFTYDHSDNSYHANSIVFDDNTGVGYFMKPKDHNTVGFETDWFKKGLVTEEGGWQRPETFIEWKESQPFRDSHVLIDDPDRPNYYRYQPVERANGGGIHIKPSHRGRLTELKKRTGKTEAELYRTGSPATRKMITFARNARKWKHGLGGNLFSGEEEGSQKMNITMPDATYVARTPIFSPISKKEYDWEDAALHRTNQVYSNYNKAKDEPLSLGNTLFRNSLRWIKDNIYEDFPSGVSNCTLSATQWVDPQTPVKGAKSIHTNPERFNYTAIDSADVVPGNLIISKVPNKDSYHTMMVTDFAGQDSTVNFKGKNYHIKKGEPLMTYSRGGHDNSFIQRNVPLSIYTANSDGHTQNLFYRYNYPREVFLPEVVVTPNKKKK